MQRATLVSQLQMTAAHSPTQLSGSVQSVRADTESKRSLRSDYFRRSDVWCVTDTHARRGGWLITEAFGSCAPTPLQKIMRGNARCSSSRSRGNSGLDILTEYNLISGLILTLSLELHRSWMQSPHTAPRVLKSPPVLLETKCLLTRFLHLSTQ